MQQRRAEWSKPRKSWMGNLHFNQQKALLVVWVCVSVPVRVLQSNPSVVHSSPINTPVCCCRHNVNNNGGCLNRSLVILTYAEKEKVNQNGGMLTCFSIKVIREASIWPLGLCVQGRKTHLAGHMPVTHKHLAGVSSSFIKLRWMSPNCGRKLERRPTQFRRGNVCRRYIGSKRKPKRSRQEATRLIPDKAWNPYDFRCPDEIHISCERPGTTGQPVISGVYVPQCFHHWRERDRSIMNSRLLKMIHTTHTHPKRCLHNSVAAVFLWHLRISPHLLWMLTLIKRINFIHFSMPTDVGVQDHAATMSTANTDRPSGDFRPLNTSSLLQGSLFHWLISSGYLIALSAQLPITLILENANGRSPLQ